MPLDPAAEPYVALLSSVFPRVGVDVVDATHARRILRESPLPRPEPEPVARVEDRSVPGPDGDPIPVRIFWPTAASGPSPAVVFLHGGGWVLCDLDTHDNFARMLTNGAQAVVVSVDYRLAPEHPYPAGLDDACAVLAWVHAHADELDVDTSRIAVAGDSAGGNLAAATALRCRDRGGPPIAFQLLVYPVLDHDFQTGSYCDNADGYFLTAANMIWYWDQYVPNPASRDDPYVSPLRAASLSGLPPTFIVTAEMDPLRDEAEAYAARLATEGVPVSLRRAPGMFHGFFGMGAVLETAARVSAQACAALHDALHSPA